MYNQGTHLHHWRRLRQQDPLLTWPLFCPTDWVHLTIETLFRSRQPLGRHLNTQAVTVGLIIDVKAVLTLVLLSHAESGMSRFAGTDEDILRAFVLRAKSAV